MLSKTLKRIVIGLALTAAVLAGTGCDQEAAQVVKDSFGNTARILPPSPLNGTDVMRLL